MYDHTIPCTWQKPLRVIFEGEPAIDEGGVRQEFFQLTLTLTLTRTRALTLTLTLTLTRGVGLARREHAPAQVGRDVRGRRCRAPVGVVARPFALAEVLDTEAGPAARDGALACPG